LHFLLPILKITRDCSTRILDFSFGNLHIWYRSEDFETFPFLRPQKVRKYALFSAPNTQ